MAFVTYAGAPLAVAALAAACFAAAVAFIALPTEPFAYYKDLGFDHMVTDWAAREVKSPLDFIDTLGWSPWNGTPLFYLNSNAPVLLSAPLSVLFGNSWLAIKIVELLQILVATASAFALYRTARRSTFWACTFALTYAAIPATTLAIRGNAAFGWIAALLPAAIVIGRFLTRRFGPRALPAAGVVCGLFGYVFAIQYLAFVSLPALAIVAASDPANGRRRLRDYVLMLPIAIVFTFAIGAFFVMPSFWHPIFSDAAARTASLASGALLGTFSEPLVGLLTLVPAESLASPIPAYNSSGSLPLLYAAGICWWLGAIAFLATSRSRSTFSDALSVIVVIACTVLALGEQIPGGRAIWETLYRLPHVDGIRTTDRFIAIPALFVAYWSTLGLENFALARPKFRGAAAWLATGVLASAVGFAVTQHCFSVEPDIGERMPELNAVDQTVSAIGGRTASFANVNGGSRFDAPAYGNPAPISAAYLDLGDRFLLDGIGASGVLGRASVRSVITAPNWSYDTPEVPPSTVVYRNVRRANAVFNSPENVRVWRIPARNMLESARIDCILGGPGAFDMLEADPEFARDSFAEPGAKCDRTGLVDFEPADDWPKLNPLAEWPGVRLFPNAERLQDTDYPYLSNRILLAIPWYRNSVGGARSDFDPASIARTEDAATTLIATTGWPAGSTIAIRLAAPNGGTISLAVPTTTLHQTLTADPRLRWYRFRLDSRVEARESVTLTVSPNAQIPGLTSRFVGIAVDGAVVLPPSILAVDYAPAFVVISTDGLGAQAQTDPVDATIGNLELVSTTGLHPDFDAEKRILSVDASPAVARYRWHGPSGAYAVQAVADIDMPDRTLTLTTDCCAGFAVSDPASGRPAVAITRATLHDGSIVSVRISSSAFNPGGFEAIASVDVRPVEPARVNDRAHHAELDFQDPLTALTRLRETSGIQATPEGLEGSPGSRIAFDVATDPNSDTIVANLAHTGDGFGTLTLACAGLKIASIITPASATAAVPVGGARKCSGRVDWRSGSMTVTKLTLNDIGAYRRHYAGDVWLPAGRFRTTLLARDGMPKAVDLSARGCERDVCTFETSGFRAIAFTDPHVGESLVLVRSGDESAGAEPVVDQTAAVRWRADLPQPGNLVLAQLFDGNWHAENNGHVYTGERCDITNTCFTGLPPGTYRIYHTWSAALVAGTAITLTTAILAAILIVPLRRRSRFSGPSQHK